MEFNDVFTFILKRINLGLLSPDCAEANVCDVETKTLI